MRLAVFVLLLAFLAPAPAGACKLRFEPKEVVVDSSGKGSFTAVIKWEHRRCPLAKDDVNVDGKGVKVLKQSGWEKVRRGLYKNRYEIQLRGKKGSIRIWRRCDKKGVSEGTITIRR